jgi:hypothetical protein
MSFFKEIEMSILTFVGNVGPKSDHMERSDLAKRFFIAGWERERAKGERSRKGRGLNTSQ